MAADTFYFNHLIEKTYRSLASEHPQIVNQTSDDTLSIANFHILDVALSVVYSPPDGDEKITIFSDFGAAPEHQELAIYKNLLETNFHFFTSRIPAFCLNPETGHILFMFTIDLPGLTPEKFHIALKALAAQTCEWRRTLSHSRHHGFAL
ncbi:CesT family type III secretion system chaperone [Pseudomonas zeae]|uniref:CesT family type III secretion system chaperone n=1 Tax=Pseudomonas zeae TaxID=2745510 RepID=UPI0039DFB5D8